MVGAVIGVSGLGVLANEVSLDVQKLGVFPSVEDMQGGFRCLCDGGDCDSGIFDYDTTNAHANMICNWEVHVLGWLDRDQEDYYGEGCSVDFWSTHNGIGSNEDKWPIDFDPDYKYNDIFQTTYFYDGLVERSGHDDDDSEERYGYDDDDDDDDSEERYGYEDSEERYGYDDDDSEERSGHDLTLQEVLEIHGMGYDSFIRESVAALLNAASDDVKYKYSVPEVIEMTQMAIVSGDYNYALEEFTEYNNYGGSSLCPYP